MEHSEGRQLSCLDHSIDPAAVPTTKKPHHTILRAGRHGRTRAASSEQRRTSDGVIPGSHPPQRRRGPARSGRPRTRRGSTAKKRLPSAKPHTTAAMTLRCGRAAGPAGSRHTRTAAAVRPRSPRHRGQDGGRETIANHGMQLSKCCRGLDGRRRGKACSCTSPRRRARVADDRLRGRGERLCSSRWRLAHRSNARASGTVMQETPIGPGRARNGSVALADQRNRAENK